MNGPLISSDLEAIDRRDFDHCSFEIYELLTREGRKFYAAFTEPVYEPYIDGLRIKRKLSGEFDAAFTERNNANAYTWAFFDDYNPSELIWLYEEQSLLHGYGSLRPALLRRKLVERGIAVPAKTTAR